MPRMNFEHLVMRMGKAFVIASAWEACSISYLTSMTTEGTPANPPKTRVNGACADPKRKSESTVRRKRPSALTK